MIFARFPSALLFLQSLLLFFFCTVCFAFSLHLVTFTFGFGPQIGSDRVWLMPNVGRASPFDLSRQLLKLITKKENLIIQVLSVPPFTGSLLRPPPSPLLAIMPSLTNRQLLSEWLLSSVCLKVGPALDTHRNWPATAAAAGKCPETKYSSPNWSSVRFELVKVLYRCIR